MKKNRVQRIKHYIIKMCKVLAILIFSRLPGVSYSVYNYRYCSSLHGKVSHISMEKNDVQILKQNK